MLTEIDAFGNGKILGESGCADQTNRAPFFPWGLSMTRLPAEAVGTVGLFSEGPRGGPYFLHPHCQHDVHITVILIVITFFFYF
jgi:hypothetical protein